MLPNLGQKQLLTHMILMNSNDILNNTIQKTIGIYPITKIKKDVSDFDRWKAINFELKKLL